MIWIFNKEDRLALICSNDLPEALPLNSATMHEVLNGDLLLEFEVPLDHRKAGEIEEGYTAAVQRSNGEYECFIIGEIEQDIGADNVLRVICRHAVIELQDEIIEYYHADRKNAAIVLPDLLAGTRWEAGTIINTDIHDLTVENETVLAALKTFLDRWEGEISYSFTISSQGIVKRKINFQQQIGQDAGRRFEWGQDLQEVQRTVNAEGVKTALIGIGKTPATDTTEEAPLYFENIEWSTEPTTTNLLTPNQSTAGEDGTEGMTGSAGTGSSGSVIRTTLDAWQGTYSYRNENTGTALASLSIHTRVVGYLAPVIAGNVYTASVYMRTNNAAAGAEARCYLGFVTAANGFLDSLGGTRSSLPNDGTWKRFDVTFTAPAGAEYAYVQGYGYNIEIGKSVFCDGFQLEAGSVLTSWQLGGTTRTGDKEIAKAAGLRYIEDPEAREKYGRLNADGSRRNRYGFYINNEITDAAQLLEETWEALKELSKPHVTYRAKVLDLAKIEGKLYKEVNLGDIVRVLDDDLKLQVLARCLEIKHNLLEPEETELLLDNFQEVFSKTAEDLASVAQRIGSVENQIAGKVERGETIKTDWLEDDIALLRERILAGGGTVTINDANGILIEEDPTGKTGGALRLLGGALALADTYNAGIGDYNWQTFGTGEGILADLILARKISFDHARGGTLILGGENNANGVLQVENATGDIVVTLDGQQGGFNELFVGTLRGDNVVLRNTRGDFSYYVDPVNGNDDNDGLSAAAAFKTIQRAIDSIPRFNNYWINIEVQGTAITIIENLHIRGFIGGGRIGIFLGRKNTLKGYVQIAHNMNEIFIGTIAGGTTSTAATGTDRAQIQAQANTNGASAVYAFANLLCNLYDVILSGNNLAPYGFNCYAGYLKCEYIEVYNATSYAGIYQFGSKGDIINCAGSNPNGLRVAHGTIVGGSGRGFYSETAGKEKVVDQGATCTVTWAYNAGAKTPVYAPVTVSTWTANDTGSLFGTNWGVTTDYIMTGQRNSSEVAWKGFAFFNTANFGALKNADGTNRPITKVRVLLQRYNGYGDNNSRKPKIWSSTQAASSGTPPAGSNGTLSATGFLWGEEKWVDLPVAIGQAFQAGTAKSLMFDNGNDLANYMRFEAKATLEITHG